MPTPRRCSRRRRFPYPIACSAASSRCPRHRPIRRPSTLKRTSGMSRNRLLPPSGPPTLRPPRSVLPRQMRAGSTSSYGYLPPHRPRCSGSQLCKWLSVSQAPLIQAGSVGIAARGIAGNQSWTHRVTFEKPYDVAPTIAMNAVESWFTATATDVATDGFTYVIRNLDSTTRPSATIRSTWVAIGPAG